MLNQGRQKHGTAFDLGGWIRKTVDERLSVADLRDAIRKTFRARAERKQILRRKGTLFIFDRKYFAGASAETRKAAVSELEKMLAELRG